MTRGSVVIVRLARLALFGMMCSLASPAVAMEPHLGGKLMVAVGEPALSFTSPVIHAVVGGTLSSGVRFDDVRVDADVSLGRSIASIALGLGPDESYAPNHPLHGQAFASASASMMSCGSASKSCAMRSLPLRKPGLRRVRLRFPLAFDVVVMNEG